MIKPNKPPFVEVLSPTGDIIFKANESLVLTLNAYDIDGEIVEVQLKRQGQLLDTDMNEPYGFTVSGALFGAGEHVLDIVAIDNDEAIYQISVDMLILGVGIVSAGDDVTLTDGTVSYVLDAENPEGSSGEWSTVPAGQGSFSDINNPHSLFTGELCRSYTLRWTVTNGNEVTSDDVVITFTHTPTVAAAGEDIQRSDGSTSAVLDANIALQGQGSWSVVSGVGGSFADQSNPKTTFTGQPCVSYVLRWTIATQCLESIDEVAVRFDNVILQANAGLDQVFNDGTNSAQLAGNDPGQFTALWTVASGTGGQFSDPAIPNPVFTGQLCQDYVLRYTITSGCGSSSDEVAISFNHTPSQADAGEDQIFSDGRTQVFLDANQPLIGEGEWSIISGTGGDVDDPTDNSSRFIGEPCETYVLRWTITAGCGSTTDDVVVKFWHEPTEAWAGPDQYINTGVLSTQLAGNVPASGIGTWSVEDGPGGSFDDVNDPATTFTGQLCGSYVLRWTIATECKEYFDEVNITFDQIDIPAYAGQDISFFDGTTSTAMNANSPLSAVGTWVIESGTNGILSDLNDPKAVLTGELGEVYVLSWNISSTCGTNSDEVKVAFLSTGSFTDSRDGAVYPTIIIGDQEWMSKNLNFKTVNYSWSYSNQNEFREEYGLLYNHEAAMVACPTGWHLPTDTEWRRLEVAMGMLNEIALSYGYRGDSEGSELKETGLAHWNSPNSDAVDLIGFKAIPSGYRSKDGSYGLMGAMAAFWTATQETAGNRSVYRGLNKDKFEIGRDWFDKENAVSVRCVRD